MPYSGLSEKSVDAVTRRWKGLEKKKMFGGICYLLHGNMCFGIYKEYLIVRLGTEKAAAKMKEPHVRAFDITGRPMKGWVMVSRAGLGSSDALAGWLDEGRAFALGLPPKKGSA